MNKFAKINMSSSFLTRSRCKKCGKHPTVHYTFRDKNYFKHPKDLFNLIKLDFSRDNYYFLSSFEPSYLTGIKNISHTVLSLNYPLSLHKNKGGNYITSTIVCSCGGTSWDSSISKKVEVTNRKCKISYPFKFKD